MVGLHVRLCRTFRRTAVVAPLRRTGKNGYTMRRRIALVTITLVFSFGLRVLLNGAPSIPNRESLANFPKQAGSWTMTREDELSDEVSRVLQADDYVVRSYRGEKGQQVDLFIAYFNVENAGEAMHSPKNC